MSRSYHSLFRVQSKLGWTQHDRHLAKKEGWAIVATHSRSLGIYRLFAGEASPEIVRKWVTVFATDDAAHEFVYNKAMEGSPLHEKAIRVITQSQMQGA